MTESTNVTTGQERVRVRPWGSLAFPQFRLLASSALLGSSGMQMREVINLWVVYQLTGSALQLGLLGALRVIPLLIIGLFGGVLADVVDRRKLLLFGQGTSLVLTSTLAALAVTDNIQLWHIYLVTLVSTSATVLDAPARMALIHGAVPRSHLTNAITLSSSLHHASLLFGPTLGGLAIGLAGVGNAYIFNAVIFVPAVGAVIMLRDVRAADAPSRPKLRGRNFLEGLRFVMTTPIVVALVVLDFGVIVFTGYRVLMPIFAEEILGVGVEGLGPLTSAPAVGFLIGAAVLLGLGDVQRKGMAVILGVVAYAAAIFAFAISDSYLLALLALVAVGASDGIGAIIRKTTVQLLVPDEIRGRATSVIQVFTRGTTSAGFLVTGAMAAAFGASGALIYGSVIALGVLVVVLLIWSQLIRMRA